MAIVKFGLKHETGPVVDQDGHRSYTRVYGVTTDGDVDGFDVRADTRCPIPLVTRHPRDTLALCIHVQPDQVRKSKRHFEVTAEFSTNFRQKKDPNPLARPAVITGDFNDVTRPVFKDRNGRLPQTTAGEPILITEEESDLILSVQKNIPPVLPSWIFTYNNCVNADAVRIRGRTAPKGTLKAKGIRFGDIGRENDIPFIPISFQLHFRRTGWDRVVLNQGLYELVTRFNLKEDKDVTSYERIKDALGREITEPVPLTRDGRAHRDFATNALINPRPDELVFLTLETPDERPFSVLPLR